MTFLAPAFLLGLLAIGVPVWLHRLSSTNPNRQLFSSSMFLEPGEPRRVLAKKLQYLLLLALRIGVLALLALAFAGPALQGAVQNLVAETARLHVVVMDLSASMGHGGRWQRAEAAAGDVVGDLGAGDAAQLVAAGRVVEVIEEPTLDRDAVRRGVAALNPGPFALDYGQLMRSVDSLARGAELPVTVHLITDAQQSALPPRFADLAPRTPLELMVHDVSAAAEGNLSVDGLAWSPVSGDFVAGVRSYADEAAERTVTLRLNGVLAGERQVTVGPGDTAQVTFGGLELAAGGNRVTAELTPGDDLAVDDTRYLVVKRPEPRPVLMVSADGRGGASPFFASALGTLAAQDYRIDPVTAAGLAERTLEDYVFVVVTDAGVLQDEDAALLRDYVETGGALFMALSRRSAGLAAAPVTGHDFEPFSDFGRQDGEFLVVGTLDRSHPALGRMDDVRRARFHRHVAVEPQGSDRVLMRLDEGGPLLIEHTLGAGRVLLYGSSLDREWNDLPVQPVFVPMIAQLAAYLAGDLQVSFEARLGAALSARAMGFAGAQVFAPGGDMALGIAGAGAGDDVLVDRIGFYEVVGAGRTELVAVNVDPTESDPAAMAADELARWRELGPGAEQADAEISGMMEVPPTELWPWILALLAALVLAESWIGNRHLRVRRGIAA